jgi:outer membrane protein assembly factor BamB
MKKIVLIVVVVIATVGVLFLASLLPYLAPSVSEKINLAGNNIVFGLKTVKFALLKRPTDEQVKFGNTNVFEVSTIDKTLDGTVLFSLRPVAGSNLVLSYESRVVEVNREGEVIWEYRFPADSEYIVIGEVRKLPNGNYLFAVAKKLYMFLILNGGQLPKEVGSYVFEVDPQKNIVKQYQVPVSHHAEYLPNGNLLAVASFNFNLVTEMNPEGEVVWQWDAKDHIFPFNSSNYVGFEPDLVGNMYAAYREARFPILNSDWTHVNSAQRLANGNTLLSLRNFDMVIEVNQAGDVVWSWGGLILKHQHCAWLLDNGNLLVTDNGNARVIEVNRATGEIVWEYAEGLNIPIQACAYRIPSGNTLITDSYNYRIIEVNPEKDIVWELKVLNPTMELYRAFWGSE